MIEPTTMPTPEIYARLIAFDRRLRSEGTENRHDLATALIGACIQEGVDVGPLILQVLARLNYQKPHVGKLLSDEGKKPTGERLWYRDAHGRYRLRD